MKKFSVLSLLATLLIATNVGFAQDQFDLRDYAKDGGSSKNYLTSVKNQGQFGICWTYAASAAMESNILLKGISGGNTPNISEWHMANYATHRPDSQYHKDNVSTQWGGFWFYSVDYIANGHGPINESYAVRPTTPGSDDTYLKYKPALDLPKMDYFMRSSIRVERNEYGSGQAGDDAYHAAIKNLIKTHGAVHTAYHASTDTVGTVTSIGSNSSPAVTKVHAYHETGQNAQGANHAVAIVGWAKDVTYTVNGVTRTADCWLIKNSWGAGSSATTNGYHYLPFDATGGTGDPHFGGVNAYDMEVGKKYNNVVRNGLPTKISYMLDYRGDNNSDASSHEWAAAKMQSNGQYIESIGVWSNYTGKDIKIGIFSSLQDLKDNNAVYVEDFAGDSVKGFTVLDLAKKIKIDGEYFIAYSIRDGNQTLNREFLFKLYDESSDYAGTVAGENLIFREDNGKLVQTQDLKDYEVTFTGNNAPNVYDGAVGVVAYTNEVPEPATLLILFGGSAGIFMRRKRKNAA